MKRKQLHLIYDKQCPVCKNYWQMVRIKKSVGELILIDGRLESEFKQEITEAGYDIDNGIVLKMNKKLYYGVDALHVLSFISSRSGLFNQLNYWFFVLSIYRS